MPTPPTCREDQSLALHTHLANDFTGVTLSGYGAKRHAKNNVLPGTPGAIVAGAPLAVLCEMVPVVTKIKEGVQVAVSLDDHRTTVPAVPSRRAAVRFVFFPSGMRRRPPHTSAAYGNCYVIDEFHTCGVRIRILRLPTLSYRINAATVLSMPHLQDTRSCKT